MILKQDETGSVPEVHVNLEQILTRVRHAIITHIYHEILVVKSSCMALLIKWLKSRTRKYATVKNFESEFYVLKFQIVKMKLRLEKT